MVEPGTKKVILGVLFVLASLQAQKKDSAGEGSYPIILVAFLPTSKKR